MGMPCSIPLFFGAHHMNGKETLTFKILDFASPAYRKAVALREKILREPLGLCFTPEELALEKDHVHIAGFLGQNLCTTAVLVPEGDSLKMQRVATQIALQN